LRLRTGGERVPSFIVKPIADEDFYVVWSTVVDAPTGCGSREELARDLGPAKGAPERFDRADKFGTSMKDPEIARDCQWFGWHDKAFRLAEWPIPNARRNEGIYQVPRENIRALCEQSEDADPTELLIFTPHEDA